ncbi:primase-helicase family protein [Vibrio breoganii]|uniref:primase-helicase family protein n=1 Tax=Vibrio breoganii TaxID=553239 RepID=UPI000C8633D0|nr:primase-helicase family protein [Vibrio breoganii]PML16373.1 hypothetical protein BCT84_06480 [Vibrio breoganii]
MDAQELQNTPLSLDEWIHDLKENGWVWLESDKPQPTLWNFNNNARSSLLNMLIRASKAQIDKANAKIALERRLPIISGVQFMPSKPQFIINSGAIFLNTFKEYKNGSLIGAESECYLPEVGEKYLPCDLATHKYAIKPFIRFIETLTSNVEDKEWLMCWMAHMIQKPEERPSVHPLFRTEHGVGKNVLVERVLNKLLCKQVVVTSLREIRGTHSESAASNLLVFVDESKAKGMNVYLEMKSLLTTSEVLVNPKHVRPYKQEVFSRFMFADNTQGRAFNIEQEDRRIYVMEYVIHEHSKEETQEDIREFLDWFNVHWDYVYGFLLNYNINEWSPHTCPMTAAKREYLDMCEDPIEALIANYISQGYCSLDEDRWNSHVMRNGYDENYFWSKLTCTEGFKYQLEGAGFKKKRVGLQRSTGYFLNNLKGKAAKELLDKEREDYGPYYVMPTLHCSSDDYSF